MQEFRKRKIKTGTETVEVIKIGVLVSPCLQIAHKLRRHLAALGQLFLRQTLLVPQ